MLTTLTEIVLIDDDRIVNELNKRLLFGTKSFEKIHAFERPRKALEFTLNRLRVQMPLPALYFVDVMMPEMDGFELIDELNEIFDNYSVQDRPKFAILSGSKYARDVEKFERAENAIEFVSKPLNITHMNEILSHLVIGV